MHAEQQKIKHLNIKPGSVLLVWFSFCFRFPLLLVLSFGSGASEPARDLKSFPQWNLGSQQDPCESSSPGELHLELLQHALIGQGWKAGPRMSLEKGSRRVR